MVEMASVSGEALEEGKSEEVGGEAVVGFAAGGGEAKAVGVLAPSRGGGNYGGRR